MGYDRLTKGRHSLPNHAYFVTAATKDRAPVFSDFYVARLVVREMRGLHDLAWVESLAWVVMPDHVHWMFQLDTAHSLSRVMQRMKGRSARSINQVRGHRGGLWQPGYFEHALRRDEDLVATARYIVANPLRAGLVRRLSEYVLWDAKWL